LLEKMISLHFTKGDIMKKRDLTLERKIGICVLGLFVFLAISCSQDVLAVDSNVTLKVNAASSTDANKIYYTTTTSSSATTVTLPWLEKAVYSGDPTDVKVTVKTLNVTGDLIIKADFLIATTPGALSLATPGGVTLQSSTSTSGGALTVKSYWLKYSDGGVVDSNPEISFVQQGDASITVTTSGGIGAPQNVSPGELPTLVLKKSLAPTTMTLFAAFTGFKAPVHIIFTAVLVNNAAAHNPQVLGVDVQSIFFNYIDRTGTQLYTWPNTGDLDAARPVWLDLIQAWSRWTP